MIRARAQKSTGCSAHCGGADGIKCAAIHYMRNQPENNHSLVSPGCRKQFITANRSGGLSGDWTTPPTTTTTTHSSLVGAEIPFQFRAALNQTHFRVRCPVTEKLASTQGPNTERQQ